MWHLLCPVKIFWGTEITRFLFGFFWWFRPLTRSILGDYRYALGPCVMPEFLAIPIKSSSLTYEPYQFSGESYFFWLWRVEIDGEVFSKTMSPIQASDARVERYGCTNCGVAGDGTGFYAVRRLGGRVVWIYEELLDFETVREFENLPEFFVFDRNDYGAILGAGSDSELPELTMSEMRTLILRYLPPASLGLYINPECPYDPSGSALLKHVHLVLSGSGDITPVSEPPERPIEIRIGLDLPGAPECCWFVGKNDAGTCAMFAAFPKLPCWLGGQQIATAFDTPGIERLLPQGEN